MKSKDIIPFPECSICGDTELSAWIEYDEVVDFCSTCDTDRTYDFMQWIVDKESDVKVSR
jgi:hypothetical protein